MLDCDGADVAVPIEIENCIFVQIPGIDDFRLAGSPYSVWKSIVETNQDHVDRFLGEFIEYLERMRSALRKGSLSAEFARAVEVYERLKADSGR